ncbi:unnamed protein product [Schistosoma curassoni]|uniref:CCHC-type domain-containing protein n=1 Tax=Schistosoma curassoni TaxID=6186 RepID=A0A183KPC4_9TREM|nr:unnamed protein product [Schistosoma curassoni]
MEKLDIHSTSEAFGDYLESFEIWGMTTKEVEGDKIVAHFLTFIGRVAYSSLKTLAYPEKPISLSYATLKELLLNHVKCTSFECRERAKVHKMIRRNDQKELQNKSKKGEIKFGKCLSCGKFHSRNSCAFRNAKCFKCGKIGHIQSVCKATVHFASCSTEYCNLNRNNWDVSIDHLSLSTISKGNVHIQKRLYTSLGSCHDFIVDTGSIESIISFKNLKSLDPNVVVRPTELSILRITGHKLPIRGCCELRIRDDNSSYIPCEFLVSETGLFGCLGYLVDGDGIRPDMKRLAPLTNASSPKNLTESRSLVGTL